MSGERIRGERRPMMDDPRPTESERGGARGHGDFESPTPTPTGSDDPSAESLLRAALGDAWDLYTDLPWDQPVDLDQLDLRERASLVSGIAHYHQLDDEQREVLHLRELGFSLSNLAHGEWRVAMLTARALVDCAVERPDAAAFLATVVLEEVKHAGAVKRYLGDRVGLDLAPHPGVERALASVQNHESWELKVLVGQVLFEGTAVTLLQSAYARTREPLISAILRRILADELRHLGFSYSLVGPMALKYPATKLRRMAEAMFEAAVGFLGALLAEPIWREFGLPANACRRRAVEALGERGVIEFYTQSLPKQLARRGFAPDHLVQLLERELVPRLIAGEPTR